MSLRRVVGRVGGAFCVLLTIAAAQPASAQVLEAAREGDAGALRALLERGADPDVAQGDGMTALHWAAELGYPEVAAVLIRAGAEVDATTRIGDYTPLHLASRGGRPDVVQALLEAGADPGAKATVTGVTPLHLGAMAVNGELVVRELIEHGAPVNALEASAGQTALMFAASSGRAGAVRELLKAGADPSISTRVVDVIRSLVVDREASQVFRDAIAEARADAAVQQGWQPSPAQVQAAVDAQREFLRFDAPMVEVDPASLISIRSDYPGGPEVARPPYRETLVGQTGGMTALLHAAREGHVEAARALLDGGADIDQVSGGDQTSPLLMATLNGQFDLAMLLIERGADPNLAASTDGASPLFAVLETHWAPKSNYPQPRAQDDQQAEYMELLNALLAAGANPNVQLNTHLWYWEFGLTKMGIDLAGATPFWRAAFAQDIDAMRTLVAHGADVDIPTVWPDPGMRERRQQDGRQQEDSGLPLIPGGVPNAYPLHAAAGGGWLGLGAFSVRSVPDNFLAAVQYLIEEHGADVNLKDSWGYTPMHYAASRGDNELIEYLVSKGGDVGVITRLGQSTADMARGGRAGFFTRVAYPETVELLQSLGSTLECLHTHFLDTGDFCPGAGVNDPWAVKSLIPLEEPGGGGGR